MLLRLLLLLWLGTSGLLSAQVAPLLHTHAHNDYEHEYPLFDALDHGFISVEADIHLIAGELYVYHDRPESPVPERTLSELYLEPLARLVRSNGGRVYANHDVSFFLMIDIKDNGAAVYAILRRQLAAYRNILTRFTAEGTKPGAVTVILSGDRPFAEVASDTSRLVGLDGRLTDLGKGYTAALLPWISDNFTRYFSWDGKEPILPEERQRLMHFAKQARQEGKYLRFWAAPEGPQSWATLLEAGVELINTDDLPGLRQFLLEANR